MKVEFYRHCLGQEEIAAIGHTIGSLFLTTGPRTEEFEIAFANRLGVDHVVGMSSCTDALFICLKTWGIGQGDKVIVPAQTFIASSNVVLNAGAEPVFCDVEKDTGCMDIDHVEKLLADDPFIKALIPVHLYGHMADMHKLRNLADRYEVKILEDAAHCVEGRRETIGPGQIGDAAAFSFYATKNITCGEGGAVATNDAALADKLRRLRLHGMDKSAAERYSDYRHWDMTELGYKTNMNDLQAAMLLTQLPKIEERLLRRESICQQYESAFADAGIGFPLVRSDTLSARHLFTVHVGPDSRDDVLVRLQRNGVGVAVNYRVLPLCKFYREQYGYREGQFPVAEYYGRCTISLPLYPGLEDDEVDYVITSTLNACRQFHLI